jgi:outer membrane protein OmpA-like peptidoglycan-associated protein
MSTLITKVRARTLGLTLAAACVASLPAHAGQQIAQAQQREPASKQENAGLVTGIAIGAVAGGPVGAIIGGAAGAWLGDRYHKQSARTEALAGDLSKSESDRKLLARNMADLDGSLSQSQLRATQLDQTLSHTNEIETDVGFRTDDASINTKAMPPLLKLGALAQAMPDVKVRVSGYADPRGSDTYNDELSKRRAEAVAAVLTQAGITPDKLIIEAHGKAEASSTYGDLDGYAFDRRVTVRIERNGEEALASR